MSVSLTASLTALLLGCGRAEHRTDGHGDGRSGTGGRTDGADGRAAGEATARADRAEERGDRTVAPAVVFRPRGRAEARVAVEVARTPAQTERGLMYREHLPPDAGMLFLFDRPRVQSFWMKNTLIALDMIFVSSDMVVAGVVENAAPLTMQPRTLPGVKSQYVVEVNAGWAREHGVTAGVPVAFVGVEPLAPTDGG
ncbi:MAG TPA: DUF192 domain-containing protein [Kofleriaceae bacterium]|nr:DUF192 domain-containing protein [Kofleriaceae bacterium]